MISKKHLDMRITELETDMLEVLAFIDDLKAKTAKTKKTGVKKNAKKVSKQPKAMANY